MNIILFGFKSCGKTTIGKLLAERLGRPFIDNDQVIEKQYEEKHGRRLSFRQICQEEGEEVFYSVLEKEALLSLAGASDAIISVGGSAVLEEGKLKILQQLGTLIYLKIDKELLKERILSAPLPAFFDAQDPEGSFEKMYQERVLRYEQIPCIAIDVTGKTVEQIALEIEKYGK
ncbi:MAG: shikimate kinase [Chlamydiota bacterium]